MMMMVDFLRFLVHFYHLKLDDIIIFHYHSGIFWF